MRQAAGRNPAEDWFNLVMTSGLFTMMAKKAYPRPGMAKFEERLERLSPNQIRLFGHILVSQAGDVRVKDIAHDMDVTAAAASQTVERLVSLGMLVRTTDPHDRRAALITVADEGRKFFDCCKEQAAALLSEIYKDIDAPEEDLAAFGRVLAAIRDSLAARWQAYLDGKAAQEEGLDPAPPGRDFKSRARRMC
ncbi:MAG: winged helix-turn-helix transcriptional regulator [Kiritimatiellae bacterium]|nr:winged helix-turn-helix transcriptional regulator [Kiritimatiellia bacterium]